MINTEMNAQFMSLIENHKDIDEAIAILSDNRVFNTVQTLITDRLCAANSDVYSRVEDKYSFLIGVKATIEQLSSMPEVIDHYRKEKNSAMAASELNGAAVN